MDEKRPLGYDGLHQHPREEPCGEHCQVGRMLAGALDRLTEDISSPDTRERIAALAADGLAPTDPWWELCRKVGASGRTEREVRDDLRLRLIFRWTPPELADALIAMTWRMHRAGLGFHEIEQTLGKALGYPEFTAEFFPDGKPNGDVCVGEHTPETLAAEAARRLRELADTIERMGGQT